MLLFFLSLSAAPPAPAAVSLSPEDKTVASIERDTALLLCLRKDPSLSRTVADCEAPDDSGLDQPGREAIIWAIYATQWLCLNFQLALFFLARGRYRELPEAFGHLSDWSVNAGPMLGVLGTIVSFAFLLAHAGADGLAALFNSYFFDAAITTIMGGFVYVLCLLLTVWIGPAVRQ